MLDFLIFAAGSFAKGSIEHYEKLTPEEREALKKELKELKESAVEKGKSLIDKFKEK
jgi:spore coat protein CotF